MRRVSSSEYIRFAVLLPELVAAVLRRESSAERMASAGVRFGGLLAWGVEQARFATELTSPQIVASCRAVRFTPISPVRTGDFIAQAGIPQTSAAIARFRT